MNTAMTSGSRPARKNQVIRVVVDANVYISALVFGGVPQNVLDLILSRADLKLHVSQPIMNEVAEVLVRKFSWSPDQVQQFPPPLWRRCKLIAPTTALAIVVADPDDDRILECAVDAQASVIVTGDVHLLSLRLRPGQHWLNDIRILTPRQFLDEQRRCDPV